MERNVHVELLEPRIRLGDVEQNDAVGKGAARSRRKLPRRIGAHFVQGGKVNLVDYARECLREEENVFASLFRIVDLDSWKKCPFRKIF